jgi:hypothetical protein
MVSKQRRLNSQVHVFLDDGPPIHRHWHFPQIHLFIKVVINVHRRKHEMMNITSTAPLASICWNLHVTSFRGINSSVEAFTVSKPTPERVGPAHPKPYSN